MIGKIRGLDELLQEAQKVYVRRDEEKAKSKAKIVAATMRGVNTFKPMTPSRVETPRNNAPSNRGRGRSRPLMGARDRNLNYSQDVSNSACFYCGREGHFKRECPKLNRDLEVFKEVQQDRIQD